MFFSALVGLPALIRAFTSVKPRNFRRAKIACCILLLTVTLPFLAVAASLLGVRYVDQEPELSEVAGSYQGKLSLVARESASSS